MNKWFKALVIAGWALIIGWGLYYQHLQQSIPVEIRQPTATVTPWWPH